MVDMHVPEDIVSNILLRLQAKPLLRFKSVSKQWCSLISDPQFMKTRSRRMLLLPVSPLKSIDYNVPVDDTANSAIKLDCPFIDQESKVTIVGSAGGIVCLLIDNYPRPGTLILYNPFMRTSRLLREIMDYFFMASCYGCHAYGLGYDISTPNDLKVVILDLDTHSYIYNLLSLKDGSWRSGPLILHSDIVHEFGFHLIGVDGTFMNGFLHWKAYNSKHQVENIAALDMTKMVFSVIDLPPQCSIHKYSPIHVLDECLCIVSTNYTTPFPVSYDVWLMKEYGVSSSWSKVFSLPSEITDTLYMAPPSCVLDNNEKFVMFSYEVSDDNVHQVFIYDPRKDSFDALNVVSAPSSMHWKIGAIEYVESLISLNELI